MGVKIPVLFKAKMKPVRVNGSNLELHTIYYIQIYLLSFSLSLSLSMSLTLFCSKVSIPTLLLFRSFSPIRRHIIPFTRT